MPRSHRGSTCCSARAIWLTPRGKFTERNAFSTAGGISNARSPPNHVPLMEPGQVVLDSSQLLKKVSFSVCRR